MSNAAEQWHQQTPLMWAAAESQPEMVKLLLQHGAKPDARSLLNNWQRMVTAEPRAQMRSVGGLTSLLYAARQGCLECVKYLVAGKADVNLPDPEGVTPMIMAMTNFHFGHRRVPVGEESQPQHVGLVGAHALVGGG